MPRLSRCIALALACCFLRAGRAITLRVTPQDGSRVQVFLYPGDILRVDLPSEPATSHQWALTGPKPPQLEQLGSAQRVFGGRLSNQGTSSFAWRAIAPGDAELTLVYGEPASRSQHPDRTVSVQALVASAPLSAESAAPDALSTMQQEATYTRSGRCADCVALDERLDLYRGPHLNLFVLHRRYRGAPGGDLMVITSGVWTTAPGTSDPTATITTLQGGGEEETLRTEPDRLVPVDAQQIPVPAPPGDDNAFHKVVTR